MIRLGDIFPPEDLYKTASYHIYIYMHVGGLGVGLSAILAFSKVSVSESLMFCVLQEGLGLSE